MASVDDLLAECADGDGWAAAAQSAHVAPAPVPTAAPALPFAHCSPPTAPLLQFNLPRCCAAGGCLRDNSRADERLVARFISPRLAQDGLPTGLGAWAACYKSQGQRLRAERANRGRSGARR